MISNKFDLVYVDKQLAIAGILLKSCFKTYIPEIYISTHKSSNYALYRVATVFGQGIILITNNIAHLTQQQQGHLLTSLAMTQFVRNQSALPRIVDTLCDTLQIRIDLLKAPKQINVIFSLSIYILLLYFLECDQILDQSACYLPFLDKFNHC